MADADELLKKASGLFTKLGSTLKQTTKQVTGLGRGAVRVELDRISAAPGQALRGRAILELVEPVDAERMVVSLLAHRRLLQVQPDVDRKLAANRSEIFRFEQELSGARRYASTTFPFELIVPGDALDKRATPGENPVADAIHQMASAVGAGAAGPTVWSVEARLEISWGRDLAHAVDVAIAAR